MAKNKTTKTPLEQIKDFCSVLHALGVVRVETSYSGSGDQGDFDNINYDFNPDAIVQDTARNGGMPAHPAGQPVGSHAFRRKYVDDIEPERRILTAKKIDDFENLLFSLLPGGWEIDSGSYGEINVDVANKKVHIVHNERVEEIETRELDFE